MKLEGPEIPIQLSEEPINIDGQNFDVPNPFEKLPMENAKLIDVLNQYIEELKKGLDLTLKIMKDKNLESDSKWMELCKDFEDRIENHETSKRNLEEDIIKLNSVRDKWVSIIMKGKSNKPEFLA